MTQIKMSSILICIALLTACVPLLAHHGAASYDTSKTMTVMGTITEYVWANPHVFVKVDAKDDSGNIVHWNIEAWNPVTQANRGWSKNTFKAGDEVEIETRPVKNGQPIGQFAGRIVINGKQFKLHND
jgi:hypothetical protein